MYILSLYNRKKVRRRYRCFKNFSYNPCNSPYNPCHPLYTLCLLRTATLLKTPAPNLYSSPHTLCPIHNASPMYHLPLNPCKLLTLFLLHTEPLLTAPVPKPLLLSLHSFPVIHWNLSDILWPLHTKTLLKTADS